MSHTGFGMLLAFTDVSNNIFLCVAPLSLFMAHLPSLWVFLMAILLLSVMQPSASCPTPGFVAVRKALTTAQRMSPAWSGSGRGALCCLVKSALRWVLNTVLGQGVWYRCALHWHHNIHLWTSQKQFILQVSTVVLPPCVICTHVASEVEIQISSPVFPSLNLAQRLKSWAIWSKSGVASWTVSWDFSLSSRTPSLRISVV